MDNILKDEQLQILKHQSVTVNNCDQEPIHIPSSIQSFGYLVTVDRFDLNIRQISENFAPYLECPLAEIIGQPLLKLFPEKIVKYVVDNEKLIISQPKAEHFEITLSINQQQHCFGAIVHIQGDKYIIELQNKSQESQSFQKTLQDAVNQAQATLNLETLYENITHFVYELTGFDRVMLYKFDEDGNGQVISESKNSEIEPFMGLHYPSTDIPKQARALYVKNVVRVISDVNAQPVKIYPTLDNKDNQPLDMSNVISRSVSPIHIQYLKNMGVKASFSMSIVHNDQLWGLIACHHYSSKIIPYSEWQNLEFLAKLYSQEITNAEILKEHKQLLDNFTQRNTFIDMYSYNIKKMTYLDALEKSKTFLRKLLNADGLFIVYDTPNQQQAFIKDGCLTDNKGLNALIDLMALSAKNPFFSSASLSQLNPDFKTYKAQISGCAAILISANPMLMITWTRQEKVQVTNWAGDPTKNTSDSMPNRELTPRNSFEIWKHIVHEQSQTWTSVEQESAQWIANNLMHIIELENLGSKLDENIEKAKAQAHLASRLKQQVNEEIKKNEVKEQLLIQQSKLAAMGEMIAAISHQWRQPLNAISISLGNIYDSFENKTINAQYLDKQLDVADNNLEYMSQTIRDFTGFFKPASQVSVFSVNSAVERALKLLKPQLAHFNIEVHLTETALTPINSPQIKGVETEFIQVLINLISNSKDAIIGKYNDESTTIGHIFLSVDEIDNQVHIAISDDGGGIAPHLIERVFQPYFSTKTEKNGTGIGLYMAKIIIEDKMKGAISVKNIDIEDINAKQATLTKGAKFEMVFDLNPG